jgi:hypothetical protein
MEAAMRKRELATAEVADRSHRKAWMRSLLIVGAAVALCCVAVVIAIVVAVAHGLQDLGDITTDQRPLPHRPPQPASVCLPLRAVQATANDTWQVTEPVLDGPAPADEVKARNRVRANLDRLSAALVAATKVAPSDVRPYLVDARRAVARGQRDSVMVRSGRQWRNRTFMNAVSGYTSLVDASYALGDACGASIAPSPTPLG